MDKNKTYTIEEVEELCRKAFYDSREFHSQDGVIDIDQCCDLPKDLIPVVMDSDEWIKDNLN